MRTDVAYSDTCQDARRIDVFRPTENANDAAILWIHGGGWKGGRRQGWHGPAEYFCARGYVCACCDYRLAPDHPYPAAVEDVRLAMSWLRSRAREFGFAPDRIAAAGSSAGGHLAALLATIDPDDELARTPEMRVCDTRPNAAVCYCAVTTMHERDRETLSEAVLAFLGAREADAPALYSQASPLDRITGREPPFLFIHGDADETVPLRHSTAMHEKLQLAGVQSQVVVLPGVAHGFGYGTETNAQQEALRAVESFLAACLGPITGRHADPDA